jgi:hypothetical protein
LNFPGALQQIFWRDVPRLSGPRIDLDHMRGEEKAAHAGTMQLNFFDKR